MKVQKLFKLICLNFCCYKQKIAQAWLRKREYISPTIIDDPIKSMGKAILRDTSTQ